MVTSISISCGWDLRIVSSLDAQLLARLVCPTLHQEELYRTGLLVLVILASPNHRAYYLALCGRFLWFVH